MNFVAYYTPVYFYALLVLVILFYFQSVGVKLESEENLSVKKTFGYLLAMAIIAYMGLRPLNYRFGDMVIYDRELTNYVNGYPFDFNKEFLFECLKYFFAKFLSSPTFFFVCTLLYVIPLLSVSKKLFDKFWFYSFFMLVASSSFWAYGVNGVRNGVATSIFLYGVTRKNKFNRIAIVIASFFIHKSMLIPILAYFISCNYKNTKSLLGLWMFVIPISFAAGGFFESLFLSLGFGDEKLQGYLGEFDAANEGVKIVVGFRWDFLFYSGFGIFAAWYFIIKQKIVDSFYIVLANTYIIANIFWVLVIRANYSNRFAYLSWFMLAIVIIYPLLKYKYFENQHKVIANIILFYVLFTCFINIYLA